MGVIGDPADLTGQDGHSKEGAAITSWRLFLNSRCGQFPVFGPRSSVTPATLLRSSVRIRNTDKPAVGLDGKRVTCRFWG